MLERGLNAICISLYVFRARSNKELEDGKLLVMSARLFGTLYSQRQYSIYPELGFCAIACFHCSRVLALHVENDKLLV